MSFLLSLKSKEIVNINIMCGLFELCVSRTISKSLKIDSGNTNNKIDNRLDVSSTEPSTEQYGECLLLADTSALYYLLLNHQVSTPVLLFSVHIECLSPCTHF